MQLQADGESHRPNGSHVRALGLICGGVVAAIGALALIGWLTGVESLRSVTGADSETKANTAICLIAAGVSLVLIGAGRGRRLGIALAAAVALVGLATLLEHIGDLDLGIDELLFEDPGEAAATPAPGRMGANTAFCLAVAGLSLLLLDSRAGGTRLAQIGAVVIAIAATSALLGHIFGVPRLEKGFVAENVTPMAVNTAVALLVLAAGLLMVRPEVGMIALARSPGSGGALIRRLLPAAILLSAAIGYMALRGAKAGGYGIEEAMALTATAMMVAVGGLIVITARRLEQAELSGREGLIRERAVLDAALDCIVTMDHRGRITGFNPAAERTFGYSRGEVLGRLLGETIVPPSLRQRHREGLARYLAGGDPAIIGKRLELTGMRADGSEFPLEVLVTRADVAGKPFFAGFLRDLSEQKRSEEEQANLSEQLRQAQKMDAIGRLAGGIAHDFNNMLTVIGGESELLLGELGPDDPSREEVERIRETSERAAALTRQLLAFSRQQTIQPRLIDLNIAVDEIAPMLRRTIGEDVELVTRLAPGLDEVRADPGQIDQVILNLAINAREAMPEGGRLTVETSGAEVDEAYAGRHASAPVEPGPYVVLAVADTGVGIDEETQGRIFEPFFTTKGDEGGTGLGLSTVYGIARQNGGFVWVYSEPGQGATFKVYLPVAAALDAEPDQTPRAPDAGAADGSETILLVEDSETVRTVVRRILDSRGYKVIEAADAGEALAAYERHAGEIELLISDVVMPGIGGPELSEKLLGRDPELRLLFMSGYSEATAEGVSAIPAGADFIQKPFTPHALASQVRRALDAG